jgi:NDP-sugar pyrophosphorylase family protein
MQIDVDLHELLAFHRASRALMTLALKRTTTPRTQGMVELDAAGRVVAFIEKPPYWAAGDLANAGLYLCEPALLGWLPGGVSDFGRDLIPELVTADAPVFGHLMRGYLLDIGTPAAYEQAQRDWGGR